MLRFAESYVRLERGSTKVVSVISDTFDDVRVAHGRNISLRGARVFSPKYINMLHARERNRVRFLFLTFIGSPHTYISSLRSCGIAQLAILIMIQPFVMNYRLRGNIDARARDTGAFNTLFIEFFSLPYLINPAPLVPPGGCERLICDTPRARQGREAENYNNVLEMSRSFPPSLSRPPPRYR